MHKTSSLKPLSRILIARCVLQGEFFEGLGLHVPLPDQHSTLSTPLTCKHNSTTLTASSVTLKQALGHARRYK